MTEKTEKSEKKRTCPVCLVVGMGGRGKTTLMQRLNSELHRRKIEKYVVNLDPAVAYVFFFISKNSHSDLNLENHTGRVTFRTERTLILETQWITQSL